MLNFVILLISAVAGWIIYQKINRRNLPPGPMPWPLIGNMIDLATAGGNSPFECLCNLSKKYGDIYFLMVGSVPTVVVSGIETIKSVTKTELYDNRLEHDWVMDRSYGKKIGMTFSDDHYWRDTRRVSLRFLRDFGFGKKVSMEKLMQDEFKEFVDTFKAKVAKDNTVVVDNLFNGPIANVVWSLICGERVEMNDPGFQKLLDASYEFMRAGQFAGSSLLGAYPFLIHYIPGLVGFTNLHKHVLILQEHFENTVKTHRENGTYKTSPADFVDAFLNEIDEKNPDGDTNTIYTDENLVCVLNDLFLTGSETSSNTLACAIRVLVQYPNVQKKVQAELDAVIGSHTPNLPDQERLPYTAATILEILRWSTIAPAGPRRASRNVKMGEYDIPKGTVVLLNYVSASFEESVWGDPHNFRPERFLNENNEVINAEKISVFGIGKRNCIGEVTARGSLFIGLTSLLQNFIFEVDPKSGVPGNEVHTGFTTCPHAFTIRVKIRD